MEWCEQEVVGRGPPFAYWPIREGRATPNEARSKRSKEDSLPQETGRAKSSRYIILLKVKRVCRLDQNTVTMALHRVSIRYLYPC